MRIVATWYGTAALHLVVDGSLGIFFDPWFERPLDAWPKIMADPKTVQLEPLDAVFVSHSHFDHVYNLPDLVHRYPAIHAFVPAVTTENCRKLSSGAIFKGYVRQLSESDWRRVHKVSAGYRAEISSQDGGVRLRATAMKSDHVRFDAYSVLRVLLNFRVICGFRYYTEFLLGFPRKEVLGWQLQLETTTESKRIVFFGSLCRQSSHALLQYAGSDCLVLPLAGRVRCQSRVQTGALLWGHILSPTTVEEMRAGIIPPVVSMYAVNPAHFDPEMAPKGKSKLRSGWYTIMESTFTRGQFYGQWNIAQEGQGHTTPEAGRDQPNYHSQQGWLCCFLCPSCEE